MAVIRGKLKLFLAAITICDYLCQTNGAGSKMIPKLSLTDNHVSDTESPEDTSHYLYELIFYVFEKCTFWNNFKAPKKPFIWVLVLILPIISSHFLHSIFTL